jgi:glucan endo-1,3-beta-glucosidase 5/6
MVGIPNDMLRTLATSVKSAENWVSKNVSAFINDGVSIRYSFFVFVLFLYIFSF